MLPKFKLPLLLLAIFLVMNPGVGSWGLTESSEARYAEISREMFLSGDYLHPTLMGIKHYHKPPLTYYITSLGYKLFGINEYGARFFLTIALVLLVILVYKTGCLLFDDPEKAFAGAVLLFAFPSVLIASRVLTTDLYLLLFTATSLYFFIRYMKFRKPPALYCFFTGLGLGFLTKGPAIFIPVFIFMVTWMIVKRDYMKIDRHWLLGSLLFVGLGGSWYFLLMADDPKFLSYFINEQIIHRAISAKEMNRGKPFWYYLPLVPLLGFPWIPFLGFRLLGRKALRKELKKNSTLKVLAISAGAIVLVFSFISSKLITYILPIFPMVALIGGHYFTELPARARKTGTVIYLSLLTLLLAALPIASNVSNVHINATSLSLIFTIICLPSAWVLHKYGFQSQNSLLYLSFIFSAALLFSFTTYASQNPEAINTYKEKIRIAQERMKGDLNTMIIYNLWVPSAAFYLNQDVVTIKNGDERVEREVQFQSDTLYKKTLIDLNEPGETARVNRKLAEKNQVFLILQKDSVPGSLAASLQNFGHREALGKHLLYY